VNKTDINELVDIISTHPLFGDTRPPELCILGKKPSVANCEYCELQLKCVPYRTVRVKMQEAKS